MDKQKRKRKVCILGTAPGSQRDAPFDDDSWEIWGLSEAPAKVARWDFWFELHNIERKRQKSQDYFQSMQAMGNRLFVNTPHDDLPDAQVFPTRELTAKYGTYFTNTISWLTAYAIHQGDIGTIGIWGVDMAQDSEYERQRPSCEYFIGLARGLGIDVIIPPESDLLKARTLYGFDDAGDRMASKHYTRKRELVERINTVTQDIQRLEQSYFVSTGAIAFGSELAANGVPEEVKDIVAAKVEQMDDERRQMQDALQQQQIMKATLEGALEENKLTAQGMFA